MNPLVLSFAAVLALAIVEFLLGVRWNASYFGFGLPIFQRRVDRPAGLADVDLEELQKRCATAAGAPIEFRRLGPELIAFREKPFAGSIHYTPIMRGVIRHRREEASVVVVGLVKWFVIALLAVFLLGMRGGVLDVLPFLGAALAILYFIQAIRFARIAKALRT